MAGKELCYIQEPRISRLAFSDTRAGWVWLVVRVWLGWEWFSAGWTKVFGGTLTWKVWDWGSSQYALTGDGNIGWVRSGTTVGADGAPHQLGVGDSVAGFAQGAIDSSNGPHPDVAYGWYVDFLEFVRDTAHPWLGPIVAIGELVIGVALILGLFTGIAAFLGAVLNFSFVFAGAAGVNPAMIIASILLMLAWRNAGWYGLDRWILPRLGCRCEVVDRDSVDLRAASASRPPPTPDTEPRSVPLQQ